MPVADNGHVSKTKPTLRGRDRKGYQASDLMAAMTDPAEDMKQEPRVEKPRVLIETVRVVGSDIMTAKDKALYEKLLAYARLHGIDKERHRIAVSDVASFVDVRNLDRLAESLERIARTFVRYDIRDEERGERLRSAMPLVLFVLRERLSSGAAWIEYSIPAEVRRVILAARDYALLEINAFTRFKCRYSAPLYQRLALEAGKHGSLRKPWRIRPEQLADLLGYPMDRYSYGVFKRDCLDKMMDDLSYPNVTRFRTRLEEEHSSGRGRKVEWLTFHVTDARRRQEERKAAHLSTVGKTVINLPDHSLGHGELPSALVVARAVTATGLDEVTLSNGWRAAYEKAKAHPGEQVVPGMEGAFLVNVVRSEGVGAGFAMWSEMAANMDTVPTDRLPASKPEAIPSPEPMPAADGQKLASYKEKAVVAARQMLEHMDGRFDVGVLTIKLPFTEYTARAYCDAEVLPWLTLEPHMEKFGVLAKALETLASVENESRKRTLRNMAMSVRDWNLPRLMRLAGLVLTRQEKGKLKPAAAPKPRVRGAFDMGDLTEACGEYDFSDPAYATSAIPWDDRAAADMEPAD